MQTNKDLRRGRGKSESPCIDPKLLPWHEIIGLEVEIFWSKNKSYEGIKGKVIDETKNLLIIRGEDGKDRKVLKKDCVFRFKVCDKYVYLDGRMLIGRPEERLKKRIRVDKEYFIRLAEAFKEKGKLDLKKYLKIE